MLMKSKGNKTIIVVSVNHLSLLKISEFLKIASEKYFITDIYYLDPSNYISYVIKSTQVILKTIKEKIKVIQVIEPWYFTPLLMFLFGSKIKFLYHSGNINYDVYKSLSKRKILIEFLKELELMIIKKSHVIMADSISLMDFFSEINPKALVSFVPETSIHYKGSDLLKNGIDLTNHSNNPQFKIGYIAMLHKVSVGDRILPRGWELPLIANNFLKMGVSNFQIIVVGDGNGLDLLKEMVKKCEIEKYFYFKGRVDDRSKEAIISSFDVGFSEDYYFNLTHRYNLGSKIMEYLVLGIPIITGNQGDKSLLLNGEVGECGLTIEPLFDDTSSEIERYIHDLTEGLMFLKNHPKLIAKMRINCYKVAEKYFNPLNVLRKISDIYEELPNQKNSF